MNDPINLIDPNGMQGKKPPGRNGFTGNPVRDLRLQFYRSSITEFEAWTGQQQIVSSSFRPRNRDLREINGRLNSIRKQAINEVYRDSQNVQKNNLTKAGLAFQKHSSRRQDSFFARNGETTNAQFNARGNEIVRGILSTNPNGLNISRRSNGDVQIRVGGRNGSGIAVRQTGEGTYEFKGFLSASRRAPPTGTRIRKND